LFFFQAEDGIRDFHVTGVQTCALPIFACQFTVTRCVAWGSAAYRSLHWMFDTRALQKRRGALASVGSTNSARRGFEASRSRASRLFCIAAGVSAFSIRFSRTLPTSRGAGPLP